MSPPYLGVEGQQNHCHVSLMASSVSANVLGLNERNYFGLSDCSLVDISAVSSVPEDTKKNLNLKATELRLGLPGSQSPERDSDFTPLSSGKFDEKQLFPLVPSKDGICSLSQKTFVSGNKRGFSDTINGFLEHKISIKKEMPPKAAHESNDKNTNATPSSKAQVVGWPPIRSFRKNTLTVNSKNNDEVDGKPSPALFIKVSMDGAPYLRKVDLRTYSTYKELSSALEQMFSCLIIGQCGPQGKEMLSETKLRDLLHGSEYVLTFEDKDGDWMLVGDVPWEMFIASCKRLKIMKGSDAIGLAPPRAMEKSKNRN